MAYDCDTVEVEATAISLRDVKACPHIEAGYREQAVSIQVLQLEKLTKQKVYSCKVEVTRNIYHCGMHSHISAVKGGLSQYIYTLRPDECENMHQIRSLRIYNTIMDQLVLNGSTIRETTLYGTVTIDGTCRGVSFSDNEYSWDSVIVQAIITITLQDYMAYVNLDTNEISLRGGYTSDYLKGYSDDTIYGFSMWKAATPDKCTELTELYKGLAKQITEVETKATYYVVNTHDKVFALLELKSTQFCDRILIQTEHPQIVIINLQKERELRVTNRTSDTNLIAYTNSKLLYVEQSYKRDVDNLYSDTIKRRCELHREILRNRLELAPIAPTAIRWLIDTVEGYTSRVLGEVLYIWKCKQVPVVIRKAEKCYNQMPITYKNESKFLAPITRVIQNHGEEIDCSTITPPLFNINEEWIGLAPNFLSNIKPIIIGPGSQKQLKFKPIAQMGIGGIYTIEELEKSQRLLRFGEERKVVENIISRRISGGTADTQGMETYKIFNQEELKTLSYSAIKQLWGWFADIGIVTSGIIGIYYIFQIIKYFFSVALNSWQIYSTIGCGMHLLAAVWHNLTMVVLNHHHNSNSAPGNDPSTNEPGTNNHPAITTSQHQPNLTTDQNNEPIYTTITHQPKSSANIVYDTLFEVEEAEQRVPQVKSSASATTNLYPSLPRPHWTERLTK